MKDKKRIFLVTEQAVRYNPQQAGGDASGFAQSWAFKSRQAAKDFVKSRVFMSWRRFYQAKEVHKSDIGDLWTSRDNNDNPQIKTKLSVQINEAPLGG